MIKPYIKNEWGKLKQIIVGINPYTQLIMLITPMNNFFVFHMEDILIG
jgi:hypothetical protein